MLQLTMHICPAGLHIHSRSVSQIADVEWREQEGAQYISSLTHWQSTSTLQEVASVWRYLQTRVQRLVAESHWHMEAAKHEAVVD